MAVVGFANVGSGSAIEQAAETVGEGIIDAGHRLVTGGLGGVMAAASRGARRSKAWQDGSVVGVLPGTDPSTANEWVDIPICTVLGHGRNRVVAQADAVIALGGGAGTLSEMAFAWIHDRLVIAVRCGGWSERLADKRIDERVRYPAIEQDRVYGAADAREALRLLERWLPSYDRSGGANGAVRSSS